MQKNPLSTTGYSQQVGSTHPTGMHSFYHPQMKLQKGNVFTSVCQEFYPQGGGCFPACTGADTPWQVHPSRYTPLAGTPPAVPPGRYPPGRYTPQAGTPPGHVHPQAGTPSWAGTPSPRQVHPPGQVPPPLRRYTPGQVHPPYDSHCSGQYAFYLNAFLF